jgi:hypothetical protein
VLTTTVRPWFTLVRHDEPEPEPAPEPELKEEPSDTDVDPEDKGKPAEKDWKAEAEKWKVLARKHESTSKANKTAAEKLAVLEESQKTDAEKLQTAKDAAEARAAAALTRAVAAEIKVLAADFADPTDAEAAVNAADYIDDKGDIDVEGIKARLNELLEAKPHWRKAPAEPPKPKVPKPDPGQGARGKPAELDYRSASKEDFTAALAEYRLSPRT